MLLASLLIPGALALVAIALGAGLGWGDSTMLRLGPGTPEFLRGPWQLGPGEQASPMFLFNFFLTTAVFALITGAVTIGEEFGWRGLLQREFIERFGRLRGVVHAGAPFAEVGPEGDPGSVVCALDLAPTQLRIAGLIATSPNRKGEPQPEMARVKNGQIVAERWSGKAR